MIEYAAIAGNYEIPTVARMPVVESRVNSTFRAVLEYVASVNAEIIWHKPVEDRDEQGNPTHNHTLVVTGVDTISNVVHLNDSGSSHGADEQVPIAVFVQSWKSSDNLMAVTN